MRMFYFCNGNSYAGKMASLYWYILLDTGIENTIVKIVITLKFMILIKLKHFMEGKAFNDCRKP